MKRRLALLALLAISCGEEFQEADDDSPCNLDPWRCEEGQTCWPNARSEFVCLNEGAGAMNEPCELVGGSPRCQQDLLCVQLEGQMMGICRPFCDPNNPNHACPGGGACDSFQLGNTQVKVCTP
jgi:hypothetical protein